MLYYTVDAFKFAQEIEEFNARSKGYKELNIENIFRDAARILAFLEADHINSDATDTVAETDTKDTTQDTKDTDTN